MAEIDPMELARGDGREGRPVLVGVAGKVYDVSGSSLWAGGEHMHSHLAGRDLSLALQAAPHGADVLERFQVVGDVAAPAPAESAPTVLPRPTGLVAQVLARHPHPVSVHFPIALGVVAALFLVAFGFARLCWLLMTD